MNNIIEFENEHFIAHFSTRGAECVHLFSKQANSLIFWKNNQTTWNRTAPILFPYVAEFAGPQLPKHGFARDQIFEIKKQTSDEIEFELYHSEETLKVFPSAFRFSVTYKLSFKLFQIQFQTHIPNKTSDAQTQEFMLGYHPAFYVDAKNLSTSSIQFESGENAVLLSDLMSQKNQGPSAPIHPIPPIWSLQNSTELLDARIIAEAKSKSLLFDQKNLQLKISTDFPTLAIWTPKTTDFICLEGWCLKHTKLRHEFNIKILTP